MKKIYSVLFSVLLASGFVKAQYANQQAFYNNLPQARYYNPGLMPECSGYFSLPGLSGYGATISNSSFAAKDLFYEGNISPDHFLAVIENNSLLNFGFATDVLGFGFKAGKNFISLNVTPKVDFNLGYNRDFFNFIINGNGPYVGKDISLDGFAFDVTSYVETGLGYTRELNDKLNVGGKVKVLFGAGNVNGNFNGVKLHTDVNDYTMTATSEFSVNAYGTFFPGGTVADDLGNPPFFNPGNLGLGLDLGATYQFSDKLQFFGSIVDLGYLKWSDYGETLYNDGTPFSYEGAPLEELIEGNEEPTNSNEEESDFFNELLDSASTIFDLKRNQVSYSTRLKTKLYVGANYEVNKYVDLQGMLHGRLYNNKLYPMYMFAGGIKLSKVFTAKLSYSGINRTYDNIGAGMVLHAGAFQLYAMMDNVYGLTRVDYARSLSGSFGINFTFKEKENGKVKKAKGKKEKAEKAKEKASKSKKLSEEEKKKEIEKQEAIIEDQQRAIDGEKAIEELKAEKKQEKAEEKKEKAEEEKEKAEEKKEKAEEKKEKAEEKKEKAEEKKEKAEEKELKKETQDIKSETKELEKRMLETEVLKDSTLKESLSEMVVKDSLLVDSIKVTPLRVDSIPNTSNESLQKKIIIKDSQIGEMKENEPDSLLVE